MFTAWAATSLAVTDCEQTCQRHAQARCVSLCVFSRGGCRGAQKWQPWFIRSPTPCVHNVITAASVETKGRGRSERCCKLAKASSPSLSGSSCWRAVHV